MINLIANHLQISPESIVKIEEFYYVFLVIVKGRRPTFVSKKRIMENNPKPLTWCLKSDTRRQEGNKWVARISGLCPDYGFKRAFIEADKIEWGKYSWQYAEFVISEPGFYQDSDGDYFEVLLKENALIGEICHIDKVSHAFNKKIQSGEMTGSQKQVNWALKIKHKFVVDAEIFLEDLLFWESKQKMEKYRIDSISQLRDALKKQGFTKIEPNLVIQKYRSFLDYIKSKNEAKWWIDNRCSTVPPQFASWLKKELRQELSQKVGI